MRTSQASKPHRYYIGIDTGTNTGFAVWSKELKELTRVETLPIHKAIEQIRCIVEIKENLPVLIRVEDARKRKWFGNSGREQLQGAGSIKRDAKIWEDFLTDLGVDFELVAPKNNKTKVNAATFKNITGWTGKTTEHSRDAGMLVYGL